jgi:enamine deaminase RidA (YjgF/YER057c/UK114 family)
MSIELINPEGLYEPPTYTHLAVARGSRIVYVSGQVGFDSNGKLVGDGDVVTQAEQAYRNVATAVQAVGGSVADIAKLTIFVVGHRPELVEPLTRARAEVFGDHKPASTFLGVERLIRPELLVEVEAVAVLD